MKDYGGSRAPLVGCKGPALESMVRHVQEHFLLIGDRLQEVEGALVKAIPDAMITRAENVFDAVADQYGNKFTAVVVNAEPMERRPEAAVRTLRELAGNARVILFGTAPVEPLARKMVQYGCDDYVISPPSVTDMKQALNTSNLRINTDSRVTGNGTAHFPSDETTAPPTMIESQTTSESVYESVDESVDESTNEDVKTSPVTAPALTAVSRPVSPDPQATELNPSVKPIYATADITAAVERMISLSAGDMAQMVLDALIASPIQGVVAAIASINKRIAPAAELIRRENKTPEPAETEPDSTTIEHALEMQQPVELSDKIIGQLQLIFHKDIVGAVDPAQAAGFLQLARAAITRAFTLQDRYNKLYKLAITDQLTGVYNRRHFENFLNSILERAKSLRFQVTLLLFDIDNFKKYNDECGHAMGDEILRETAHLMKRCTREHDLVARIGGDEFAVVFWEKELPRQAKNPSSPIQTARVPQEPLSILQRFRRLISSKEFSGLGSTGKGVLTISGGLASFPWDGHTPQELIDAADRALIFGAKKSGKNSIYLVGDDGEKIGDGE